MTTSAPCSPILSRRLETPTRALNDTPLTAHCCFLSNSCSCLTSDSKHLCFQNNTSLSNIASTLATDQVVNIYPKAINVDEEKFQFSSDAESESESTIRTNSDGSFYSSTSLDYNKSESNSKSISESDIKSLIIQIKNNLTDESTSDDISEISLCSDEGLEDCTRLVKERSSEKKISEPGYSTETSALTEPLEYILRELDSCSHSSSGSSDNSVSSDSSAETLVYNPCSNNLYSDGSNEEIDKCKIYDTPNFSELDKLETDSHSYSSDNDDEIDLTYNDCSSSDSDCESVVLEELSEIFKKFGFISQLEDFQYREFRSIGRYSTIHEESGEDSEDSNTSQLLNTIVRTSYGMGQYYTTAAVPLESDTPSQTSATAVPLESNTPSQTSATAVQLGSENLRQDPEAAVPLDREIPSQTVVTTVLPDSENPIQTTSNSTVELEESKSKNGSNKIKEFTEENRSTNEHHYDDVDLGNFENDKPDDIVDYKSDQFSKSPRSSQTSTVDNSWRTSQASTNTIGSSSTAADSDDTLGKDMSELSSINSRLSIINDPSDPGFATLDRKSTKPVDKSDTRIINSTPIIKNASETVKPVISVPVLKSSSNICKEDQSSAIIQDTMDFLQNVELPDIKFNNQSGISKVDLAVASKECRTPNETQTKQLPPEGLFSVSVTDKPLNTEHELFNKVICDINSVNVETQPNKVNSVTVEIVGMTEKKIDGKAPSPPPRRRFDPTLKKKKDVTFEGFPDDKPPLPPSASPIPKPEVKKRWWNRSKDTPIFISRESYNEDQVAKELERLRQSYKESDLNDFLDALDKTSMPTDIDEEFFEKLLADLREDLQVSSSKSSESINLISEAPLKTAEYSDKNSDYSQTSDVINPKSRNRSFSASREFIKVKERVKELLRRRKKHKDLTSDGSTDNVYKTNLIAEKFVDSRPETPSSRPLTPSNRSISSDTRNSRPQTPDNTKDDDKKSFSLSGFFLRGSPKLVKRKYSHDKRKRHSNSPSLQEMSDDNPIEPSTRPDQENESIGNFSNLVDHMETLSSSQELKKEVRFCDTNINTVQKEKSNDNSKSEKSNGIIEISAKKQQVVTLEETVQPTEDGIENAKSFDQTSTTVIPLTVENLNRAECLLPKLPERVKPPRRRKKQKYIPVTIDDITAEDFRESITSDQSLESNLDRLVDKTDNEDKAASELNIKSENLISVKKISAAEQTNSDVAEHTTGQLSEFSIVKVNVDIAYHQCEAFETIVPLSLNIITAPEIRSTTIAPMETTVEQNSSSVIDHCYKEADKLEAISPPHTKEAFDKVNEMFADDCSSLNAYSDVTDHTHSTKEPSPVPFPDIGNSPSFYENNNPFTEEINESNIKRKENVSNTLRINEILQTKSAEQCEQDAKSEEGKYSVTPTLNDMKGSIHTTNIVDESSKTQTISNLCNIDDKKLFIFQPEAVTENYPPSNKKIINKDIDTLTSLAEELNNITYEMEKESEAANQHVGAESYVTYSQTEQISEQKSALGTSNTSQQFLTQHVLDTSTSNIISRVQVNNIQQSYSSEKLFVASPEHSIVMGQETQIEHFVNEVIEELPKNLLNTEDSFREEFGERKIYDGDINKEYDSSLYKGFYGPPVQFDYKYQHQNDIPDQKLMTSSTSHWVKSIDNPVPIPPRQFQKKMPTTVVAELKSVLSDCTKLRKAPDPLPRWDSNVKYNELLKKKSSHQLTEISASTSVPIPGRSIVHAAEIPCSTKPAVTSLASQTEATMTDPNLKSNNVSLSLCNLTQQSNGVVDNIFSRTDPSKNSSVDLSDIPTESLTTDAIENMRNKNDKETNVCFPKVNMIDKSSGLNKTFKVRTSVYGNFEMCTKWQYERIKPTLPLRRVGSSIGAKEDGYQSDPGTKTTKHKTNRKKCLSLFVESDYNPRADVDRKLAKKRSDSVPPERPPPPKSILLIPTLMFMSEVTDKRPPPVPIRRSFVQHSGNQKNKKFNKNNVYIDRNSECLNRKSDAVINYGYNNARMSKKYHESYINSSELDNSSNNYVESGGGILVHDICKSGTDKTCSGAGAAGGSGGGVCDAGVAGPLPKESVSSLSEARQFFPPPTSHNTSIVGQTLNNTCDKIFFCDPSDEGFIVQKNLDDESKNKNKFVVKNISVDRKADTVDPKFTDNISVAAITTRSNEDPPLKVLLRRTTTEGVFTNKLNRVSQLLDDLDRMEIITPTYSNHLPPNSFSGASKRSLSPPPRPRTPIDERDPEQVRAEQRYESYFKGIPRAQHKPGEEVSSEPTFEQLQALNRYSNYFLGPPRASTPPEKVFDDEPDEAQRAAQKRYEGYFKKGPPRPRPKSENFDRPLPLDREQLEAEERYKTYFQSGPPRPPRPSTPENKPELDAQQQAAEKRYQNYFKSGPPRPKSQADVDFGLEKDKQLEAERRYQKYFEGGPRSRCTSLPETDRTPSPDKEQLEAEKRYQRYFTGPPKAKHDKNEEVIQNEITKEMIDAEERLRNYFLHPVPRGEPKQFIEPPLKPEEIQQRKLLAEYFTALQERNKRRTLKVVKVSKAKKEIERESTPPSQRELVVEEFLQKVKNKKKERDLHYGDTDSDDEETNDKSRKRKSKSLIEDSLPSDLILEGGGTLAERVASDLGTFIGDEGEFY